jgi:hypothetical protein
MTSNRIELHLGQIARLADAADLAEVLFPGNRNQQHAFLVLWIPRKWGPTSIVPNASEVAARHGVTRRTMERVRAKLRRLGLIERVSRFNARYGGQEGWVLSTRFERGLHQLADRVALLRGREAGTREKDQLLIDLADARRAVRSRAGPVKRGDS